MRNTNLLLLATVLLIFISSCKKDDEVAKPQITITELGYENTQTAYAGGDLHMEADIIAEGTINTVTVEIHPEGEEPNKISNAEWIVDTVYTKFSGLKNTLFHEHLEVPADADTGNYHFHFNVIDMEGNSTTIEKELLIKHSNDTIPPVITVATVPEANQEFMFGEAITISGTATDNGNLGGLYIGLVRKNQDLADNQVNALNTITLLHFHEFENANQATFETGIVVGSEFDNNEPPKEITGDIAWETSEYYLLVVCKDSQGNASYSQHYDIILNF